MPVYLVGVNMQLRHFHLEFDIGTFVLSWNKQQKLCRIRLFSKDQKEIINSEIEKQLPLELSFVIEKILDYFEKGKPLQDELWNLLHIQDLTEFQKQVYKATMVIPYGETRSYGWVAERVGHCLAGRAVGQALKKNPFPILIPCHRVVSTQGGVGGFLGKLGPEQPEVMLKQELIDLERDYVNPTFSFIA